MTKTTSINLCHSRQVEMVTIESAVHAEVIFFLSLYSICTFNIWYINTGDNTPLLSNTLSLCH